MVASSKLCTTSIRAQQRPWYFSVSPYPHHLITLRVIEEILPGLIPTESHLLDLHRLERIHGNTSYKGDMHTQTAVDAGAGEADEGAELGGRPLWGGGATIAAAVVSVGFLDLEKLFKGQECQSLVLCQGMGINVPSIAFPDPLPTWLWRPW